MAKATRTRLARMTASAARDDSAAGLDRGALSAWEAVCAVVRDGLARAGVDPARVRALSLATPSPRASGQADVPGTAADSGAPHSSGDKEREAPKEFVIEDADGLAGMFAGRMGDLAGRYQDGQEPDFANASLAELFAWCLARAEERL